MSRTVTRGLTALALGGLSSLTLLAAPASAVPCPPGTYPPGADCIAVTITVTVVVDGKTFTVTLTGYAVGSKVTLVLHHGDTAVTLGTFIADADGNVTATVRVPSDFPTGAAILTASGVDANGAVRVLSADLTVKSAGGGLPFTGFELGAASLLGAGLLGAGGVAVISGRKRKAGTVSA